MKLLKHIILVGTLAMATLTASAQVGIKTNLLGWGTTTTNAGLEAGVSKHVTLQALGYFNPWNFGESTHFLFWGAQPEYRYWFCETFNGHFVGVHALGGQYNAKKVNFPLRGLAWGAAYDENENFPSKDHGPGWPDIEGENAGRHVEGWYAGAGLSYGYQWIVSKHWNVEASVGVGYVYSPQTYYGRCQQVINRHALHYVGPTNAQLSVMYIF